MTRVTEFKVGTCWVFCTCNSFAEKGISVGTTFLSPTQRDASANIPSSTQLIKVPLYIWTPYTGVRMHSLNAFRLFNSVEQMSGIGQCISWLYTRFVPFIVWQLPKGGDGGTDYFSLASVAPSCLSVKVSGAAVLLTRTSLIMNPFLPVSKSQVVQTSETNPGRIIALEKDKRGAEEWLVHLALEPRLEELALLASFAL